MNYFCFKPMRKMNSIWLVLAMWNFLVGCMDERTTGTSSTTGNPTKVGLGFQQDGATVRITGRAQLYASSQIPVFDSVALAVYELKNQDSLYLTKDTLEAILNRAGNRLAPISSDSVLVLNAIITSVEGQGAMLMGIRYNVGQGTFQKLVEWIPPSGKIVLGKMVDYHGNVSVERSDQVAYYIFVSGSPFYARLEIDGFTLKGLLPGRYEPLLMPVATARTSTNSPLESRIFLLNEPLKTGEEKTFQLGALMDTVQVPDPWWMANFAK